MGKRGKSTVQFDGNTEMMSLQMYVIASGGTWSRSDGINNVVFDGIHIPLAYGHFVGGMTVLGLRAVQGWPAYYTAGMPGQRQLLRMNIEINYYRHGPDSSESPLYPVRPSSLHLSHHISSS